MENREVLEKKSESISNYIRECSGIIHEKGHSIAEEYGLTYDQYHILLYLRHQTNPPSINTISEKFNRAQNTISEKISRLEEKNLVEKIDDKLDRRITRVIITEKGNQLIKTIRKERNVRIVYNALETMNEKEIDSLLSNLNKLYDNLKEGD
ncbi:MAG: winged helix DNA-binding protein [Tissierellia bacterium]|nr:winged helix DNA-binding protein [Tissierellia bacterium]